MMAQHVYRCGVPYHHNGQVVQVPEAVREQLWLGHRARQVLVEIDWAHDAAIANVWAQASPAISRAQTDLAAAERLIDEARQVARNTRSKLRSVAVDDATAEALKTAKAQARKLRETIRAEKQRIRGDDKRALSAVNAGLAGLERARTAAQKEKVYGQFSRRGVFPRLCDDCWAAEPTVDQESGVCSECGHPWPAARLYWGTCNKIIEQHNTAAGRIRAKRNQGEAAEFRRRRFEGEGRIAVQLARAHGDKCRCVKCTERECGAWSVVQTEHAAGLVVSRKETGKPRRPAVAQTTVPDAAAAVQILARAADVPTSAIVLAQPRTDEGEIRWRKPAGDGPRYVRWVSSALPDRLAGLGEPKDPPRTAALLAADTHKWANVFRLRPWMSPEEFDARAATVSRRCRDIVGEVTMQVGGGVMVTLPVVLSRMIPADAEICEAQLVVTRKVDQMRMHLCVTVDVPDPRPVGCGPVVAVHLGWRARPDGSVRVATWAASEPIVVPADLARHPVGRGATSAAMTAITDRCGEVVLPAQWTELVGRPAHVEGVRATAFNAVRDKFADWLDERGPLPPTGRRRRPVHGHELRRWRSIDRFAALVRAMLAEPPVRADEILPVLAEWADNPGRDAAWHGDRHLCRYAGHEADQINARRDELWQLVATRLAQLAGEVRIDDVNLAVLRRRPAEETTAEDLLLPGVVQDRARARARLASPGALRETVKTTASVRGVRVVKVAVAGLGRVCPACDFTAPAGDPRWAASASVPCDRCGGNWDQDVETVRAMLAASGKVVA